MSRTLITSPAYLTFTFPGSPAVVINITPDDQMDAFTLTFNETFADQMTQASESPADKTVSGLTIEGTLSIASVGKMDLFKQIFQGATEVITGTAPNQKKAIGIASRPGCAVKKGSCLIKYASCGGPSTDTEDWFYMPNAALITADTSLNFSKTDQASYNLMITAFDPPADSDYFPYKIIRGDITAIAP